MLYNVIDYSKLEPDGDLTERARLFIGYKCNIKCKFCFYSDMVGPDIKHLIFQQLKQGARYGIKDWDISGGEPSILPYWFDLLQYMKYSFRKIAVVTNGYKFADKDFMKLSMETGLNEILFSLHGSLPEKHDRLTGVKGSWLKIMRAIENAQILRLPIRINTVVTNENYKDLPNIARLCKWIKPDAFNFLPFRLELNAPKSCSIRYSLMEPYIKTSIDILESIGGIRIAVRYIPFCVLKGYEKYVEGFLQKSFDDYEWNEYAMSYFENARFNKDIPVMDLDTDKWELEKKSLQESIEYHAGHSKECVKCRYLHVCDGIWKGYHGVYGVDEFIPIQGEKIYKIKGE